MKHFPIAIAQAVCILALSVFASGCATEEGRPISENGQALKFQVIRAIATKEPQSLPTIIPIDPWAAAFKPSYTVNPTYQQVAPKPSWSHLIVECKISGVTRLLQFTSHDVQLVDGRGIAYETFFLATGANTWGLYSTYCLDKPADREWRLKWIFTIPDDAVDGATIRFQERQYPLTIGE